MRVRRGPLFAALVLAGATCAATPFDPEFGDPPPGTLGLLQWTALTGASRGLCPAAPAAAQALHSDAEGAGRIGELLPPEVRAGGGESACSPPRLRRLDGSQVDLPTRELGYEEIALIAGDRRGDAVSVFLGDGWAWMRPGVDAVFHPIEALLPERLGYLTESFDGRLCDSPVAADCRALADAASADDAIVRVLASRRVEGRLWLEVELHDNVCEVDEPALRARGWLPALDRQQRWAVWYYSRGC